MRSAECGMRNCSGRSVGERHSSRHSAFRIPHSALGGDGRGGEDRRRVRHAAPRLGGRRLQEGGRREGRGSGVRRGPGDRKSTRLNSSHTVISYAVFCLKKKNKTPHILE